MICYAVIDTNVLVSALLTSNNSAATAQITGRMIAGEIIPVYSGQILAEYRDVLNRKKFGFDPEITEYLIRFIEKYGILVYPTPTGIKLPDAKDIPFYEVVMEKRKDQEDAYLVTGNQKHFPKEPFIVTARELLDILTGKEN